MGYDHQRRFDRLGSMQVMISARGLHHHHGSKQASP